MLSVTIGCVATAPTNFYDLLGIAPSAGKAEIERAYKRAIRHWHPDLNPDPGAHAQTVRINQARDTLLDADKRAQHDRSLGISRNRYRSYTPPRPGAQSRPPPPPPRPAPPPPPRADDDAPAKKPRRTRDPERVREEARRKAERRAREEEAARRQAEEEAQRQAVREEAEARARARWSNDEVLAWDDSEFRSGHWYANGAGPFEVLTVTDGRVRIRYPNLLELTLPANTLWAQWQKEGRIRAEARGWTWTDHVNAYGEGPAATPSGSAAPEGDGDGDPRTWEIDRITRVATGMTSADAVFTLLRRAGWGHAVDQRNRGGHLWFLPNAAHLVRFRKLAARLNDQGRFPLFAGVSAGKDAWYAE